MKKQNNICNATASEKEIFLMTLCALANIDSKLHKAEIEYIEQIATDIKAELKPVYFTVTASLCLENINIIQHRHVALELIKYMLTLAYTDSSFSDSEGQFICDIADALNIEPEKVGQISSWVIDRIIWLEQEALIFEYTNSNGGEND